jgi:predicted dehydrogenase
MDRVRWGVLSTARIGIDKVIPAMQKGKYSEVVAIASRDGKKAEAAARKAGIPKWFGSYQELVDSPDIDAIYNPLPNHLHVPWTIASMKAGKHVLCEKPISLSVADVKKMIRVRDRAKVKVCEAFMVRTHPQWLAARDLAKNGAIGRLVSCSGVFSFTLGNKADIRNRVEWGGGAMWDIGCYPVTTSRFVFGEEPGRVVCVMARDPASGVDRLESAILDFPSGQAVFVSSICQTHYQRMTFFGTEKRLEVEIPFNAPNDKPCRLMIGGGDPSGADVEVREIPVCDQYTIQGDAVSRAILENTEVPVPLEESLLNTRVIEALFRSAKTRQWQAVR